jgi:ribosome-associated protein
MLRLAFDQSVTIDSVVFRDQDHRTDAFGSSDKFCLRVDGEASFGEDGCILTAVAALVYGRSMAEPIRIARGILIPEAALEWRAVRSSGPGGQNVNKVASKVDLRVDLGAVTGLSAPARARLEALCASRRDADGRLLVTSQRTRDQLRNLEDARDKVKKLVERALREPRPRRLTQPSRAAVERRLQHKRVRSSVKRERQAAADDE